jgi:hypothetical protein
MRKIFEREGGGGGRQGRERGETRHGREEDQRSKKDINQGH